MNAPTNPACFPLASGSAFRIEISSNSSDVLVEAAKRYEQLFFVYGMAEQNDGPDFVNTLTVRIPQTAAANDRLRFGSDESYELTVASDGSFNLNSATVWGALRGLETASQLIARVWETMPTGALNASHYQICEIEVKDSPRFPYRGLLLDTARHFLTIASIKAAMDLMAGLKMNALHLHLTDDQSWPVFLQSLPELTNISSYTPLHVYSESDLRELVEYGRLRGILVVPEIDFPRHVSAAIRAIPSLGCYFPPKDGSPGYRALIDPTFPLLWPVLLKGIWSTLDKVFPPESPFHIGGDEVDYWSFDDCPQASRFMKENRLDAWRLYKWFEVNLANNLIEGLGRTVIAWEDLASMIDGNFTRYSEKLVLQQWASDRSVMQQDTCSILSTGIAGVISSGPYSILTSPQDNYFDPLVNITARTCPGAPKAAQQMMGPELLLWDDTQNVSSSDLIVSAMQSILAVAESGWSPQSVVAAGKIDAERYADHRCRLSARGVSSHAGPYAGIGTFCVPPG